MKLFNRIHFLSMLCLLSIVLPSLAQTQFSNLGDEQYQPKWGQSGKDVIWIPTASEMVTDMLKIAKVTSKDLVYDLGAGDGKIAIAAAKEFGAKAVGIEFNEDMAKLAQRNAQKAGVSDLVKIIHGDIFVEDFTKADVVTLYLLPDLNLQLRPTLLKMKPGTRIVAHAFNMGEWEPDKEMDSRAKIYHWIVPADVAGEWLIDKKDPASKVTLNLVQRFQKLGGSITVGKDSHILISPTLEGNQLRFGYFDKDKMYRSINAVVEGSQLKGEEKGGISSWNSLTGVRR
jgi:SAM-dependent methyltransferase